jgi:CSLREA domain-containing protein
MTMNHLKFMLLVLSVLLALTAEPLDAGYAVSPLRPAAILVNSTFDQADFNPGDGVCETAPGNGICTLRAAIMEANSSAAAETITFLDQPGSPDLYTLTLVGIDDIALLGDLDILVDVTIQGISSSETIVQAGLNMPAGIDRVFHILGGASVTFERLTIRHGNTTGNGGGILNAGAGQVTFIGSMIADNAASHGAGAVNEIGELIFIDSILRGNQASNQGGGLFNTGFGSAVFIESSISNNSAGNGGGGIFNEDGMLNLERSTVDSNTAGDAGGGILNGGQAMIINSTLSGNTAGNLGGGIFTINQLTLSSATLTLNGASSNGGGIYVEGQGNLTNTIVAANSPGGDCFVGISGTLISGGYNLDSDGTCNLTQSSDIPLGNAALAPLQNNGGPTLTHALLDNSQAIDTGSPICLLTDQRGEPRPQDGDGDGISACDIGAFEREGIFISFLPFVISGG